MTTAPALPLEIATIRKSARESLSVRLCEYEGRAYLDIRTLDIASGSNPAFTKKGVTLAPRLIAELRAALDEAERQAIALGLLTDGAGR
ncbi:hypothetical protein [Ancylobacter terrae]|uniref:hypothetical protein n=1 Tax=Ancylobacter sp. sgz301288 TaxID=3342077 RepID=UPI00385F705B